MALAMLPLKWKKGGKSASVATILLVMASLNVSSRRSSSSA